MTEFFADFDAVIDRSQSESLKWGRWRGQDVIPAWVADMDVAVAEPILAALRGRLDHPILGYDRPGSRVIDSVLGYLDRWHGWSVDAESLVFLPGLVPAINWACAMAGESGDEILVPAPVYPPFLSAPGNQGRTCVRLPHRLDGDTWRMDIAAWDALVTPRSKALLFCHPHNPLGRNWSDAELMQVADFCQRHDLLLISDEIHCQILLDQRDGTPFTSPASLPGMAERTVSLVAPSKTYNIPGLACAYAVIPDGDLRRRFQRASAGCIPEINPFGLAACAAAYEHGEDWRQTCMAWLRRNRDLLRQAVAGWDGVHDCHIDSTYLPWLDVRELGLEDPAQTFIEGGVGLHDGRIFGAAGFVRVNLGTPLPLLERIIERMGRVIASHR